MLDGHKTSVSLEEAFWTGLKEIAYSRQKSVTDLVTAIDRGRKTRNLSSELRLYVLAYYHDNQRPLRDTVADEA